jgi:hypothetical protein
MASKSDDIVQQVQHDFQTLWADITGSEGTGVVYLRRTVCHHPKAQYYILFHHVYEGETSGYPPS